jgi:hypothetical protein
VTTYRLQSLVENCPFLDDDDVTTALRLLTVQCPKLEMSFSDGAGKWHYIEPGTVLRSDGKLEHGLKREQRTAIFCSAPYITLERPEAPLKSSYSDITRLHRSRTLLECLYGSDSTEERETQQVIRKIANIQSCGVTCVGAVWYLICGNSKLLSQNIMCWLIILKL